MQKKLSRGLILGLIGNIFFLLFGFVCFIYYIVFSKDGIVVPFIEVIAYSCEILGFLLLLISDILLCRCLRGRVLLKIGFSVYIVTELVMMIMELISFRLDFYEPYSLVLAIGHAVFSALVCFAFLSLDPGKTSLEILITVCFGVILCGMFGNIFGVRIYFSIITNAVAFTIMFASLISLRSREKIEIDCYGDKARVAEYKSTFF